MANWKKSTVIGLVVCLLHSCMADAGLATNQTKPVNPDLTKQQVSQFGVGANVKAEWACGKRLKGSIQSVEEGGFLLASNSAGSPARVAYDEVTELKQTKVTHNGKEQAAAAKMKRVAERLGVGRHVMVKTAGEKE
jgi:hypothetical protein